ncbi:MAG: peptidoglycan D,D-transpeptidase FtsI family protein [Gammaproteobacteria bacterium]
MPGRSTQSTSIRWFLLIAFFALLGTGLILRALWLELGARTFLLKQMAERDLRILTLPAHRGLIVDRHGEPLAVSAPVEDLCLDPRVFIRERADWAPLARMLGWPEGRLARVVEASRHEYFLYLRRDLDPFRAENILDRGIPGVFMVPADERFYPAGAIASQLVGYTNIDDQGQGGLELEFNRWLRGRDGRMEVIQNGRGQSVSVVRIISRPQPGRMLRTSLDLRLQYLAYRALRNEISKENARSGSVVVVSPQSGEILAMASFPSFNPNNRATFIPAHMRARAATDMFEPGSSFKPFTISAALVSGRYEPWSLVNTGNGVFRVGDYTIRDDADWGIINLTTLLEKSSNVGAAKIALSLPRHYLWQAYRDFGFGQTTGTGFPGESPGLLHRWFEWPPAAHAAIAYGYGVSVTALQLARAYSVLADGGIRRPLTFLDLVHPPRGRRVIPARLAHTLRTMLETVVSPAGTGFRAQIPYYRVAGKTGTARLFIHGHYSRRVYNSVFAGMAPAGHPRFVVIVIIKHATRAYFGGLVAAPVFAKVMQSALRLYGVAPSHWPKSTPPIILNDREPVS